MRRIGLLLILLLNALIITQAQTNTAVADATDNQEIYVARVLYESAFVRQLPTTESELAASVFENDVLQAIGRNADGSWLQVRRPGRDISLGWIAKRLNVFTFDITRLPITDFTTGITGSESLFDSGVSVFILTESNMRSEPFFDSSLVGIIPLGATIPAIERNIDERWIKVNYLGTAAWVSSFNFSTTDDLAQLPVSVQFNPNTIAVSIIPPEVQIAQVYRMRDYVQPIYEEALGMVAFWNDLSEGLVVPCNPPTANFVMIEITTQDLYELPELRTAARRLAPAIDDLNATIETMRRCGVYTPREISVAAAQAVNARIILSIGATTDGYCREFDTPTIG
jgi:hypothetical protein